jgi:hypothetical protein
MNRELQIYLGVLGLFIGAALVAVLEQSLQALGLLVVLAGCMAITFKKSMAERQRQLAGRGWAPARWKDIQPFHVMLWGIGTIVIGGLVLIREMT